MKKMVMIGVAAAIGAVCVVGCSNPTFHITGKLEKVSVGIYGLSASFGDIAA